MGGAAEHGFLALAVYDQRDLGGNEDGLISADDFIWRWLRLWVDANHDGVSQAAELKTLSHHKVTGISLAYTELDHLDGNLNLHAFGGTFLQRVHGLGGWLIATREVHDIFFVVAPDVPSGSLRS